MPDDLRVTDNLGFEAFLSSRTHTQKHTPTHPHTASGNARAEVSPLLIPAHFGHNLAIKCSEKL